MNDQLCFHLFRKSIFKFAQVMSRCPLFVCPFSACLLLNFGILKACVYCDVTNDVNCSGYRHYGCPGRGIVTVLGYRNYEEWYQQYMTTCLAPDDYVVAWCPARTFKSEFSLAEKCSMSVSSDLPRDPTGNGRAAGDYGQPPRSCCQVFGFGFTKSLLENKQGCGLGKRHNLFRINNTL